MRGIWRSLDLWGTEVIFCIRERDRYWLSRPLLDRVTSKENESNNPFQATYFSIAREALSLVRDQDGARSLCDVGAGNGRVAGIALDLGFQDVWGVEIDKGWRDALCALRARASNRFDFIIGDAMEVMPKRRFDTVFVFNPMNREKFARLLQAIEQRGCLPGTFVFVNPEYDELMIGLDYEVTHTRSNGKHVEFRVFKRRKP